MTIHVYTFASLGPEGVVDGIDWVVLTPAALSADGADLSPSCFTGCFDSSVEDMLHLSFVLNLSEYFLLRPKFRL